MAWIYGVQLLPLTLSPPSLAGPRSTGHRRAQHVGSRPAERFFWLLFLPRTALQEQGGTALPARRVTHKDVRHQEK